MPEGCFTVAGLEGPVISEVNMVKNQSNLVKLCKTFANRQRIPLIVQKHNLRTRIGYLEVVLRKSYNLPSRW